MTPPNRHLLEAALNEALQDEYKACVAYAQIIAKFGPVRPFTRIIEAERRHIQALLSLFRKYRFPIPVNTWAERLSPPDSLRLAYLQGVEAEIENGEMYRRLLAMTRDYPDVQRVFLNLQWASQENHLRAFQRAAGLASAPAFREELGRRRRGGRCRANGACRGS